MLRPFALLVILCALAVPTSGQPPEPPSWVLVSEISLPLPRMRWAQDIRWQDDSKVAVASGREGVLSFPISTPPIITTKEGAEPPVPRNLIAGDGEQGGFWLASRLARAESAWVTASPVHAVAWQREGHGRLEQVDFVSIVDLDASGDRLLVLGQRRDEEGRFAPDGALAWIGTLGEPVDDWKVLQLSVDGPGAANMDACAILELGAVRFLDDGSFLLVPGVQPGIFLYDPQGRLVRTWDSDELGFHAGCGISEPQKYRLSADPDARQDWIDGRRILDEILPLPSGPGLVIRSREQGLTTWELVVLGSGGSTHRYRIPFESPSHRTRLRGDVRGSRLALLVVEGAGRPRGPSKEPLPPAIPLAMGPRILVFDLGSSGLGK